MPEFDGVQIAALASFAVLVVAWLFAPTGTVSVATQELPAAAAA